MDDFRSAVAVGVSGVGVVDDSVVDTWLEIVRAPVESWAWLCSGADEG